MRIFRIVNVIPNDHSNEVNTDAEPSITVNPSNTNEMVVTAFTPTEAGNPNGPLFFSTDGGENWSLRFDIPGGETHDQSPLFAKTSDELYLGTLRGDTGDLNVLHTADPATVAAVPLETRPPVDQPWVEATTVIGGSDDGKDRVYVGYNRNGTSKSATVDICLDARAGAPVFNRVQLDPRNPSPNDGYEIRPTAHPDGTVYIAYKSRSSFVHPNSITDIVVARDDNWGAGGSPFTALIDPGDGKAGVRVATNLHINEPALLGGIRLNNDLNIAVDPTNSDVVYIVWCDNEGPNYTLRVRNSVNRGVDWSGDLLVAENAAMATMTMNNRGMVGLFYQQLVSGQMETHFRSTVDGTHWDDTLLARTATSPSFTGDYCRLVAVGSDFYGVFPAMNSPNPANFFPNGEGTFRYQRNTMGNSLLGNDGATVINESVDPFFFKVQQRDCIVITDRSTFGQDEINAMLHVGSPAVISAAFYVVVDGFRASELNITAATLSGTPNVAPAITFNPALSAAPAGDFRVVATRCVAEDPDHLEFPQRFTWTFDFKFFDDSDFTQEFRPITLTASITSTGGLTITGQAVIILTTQPNPYEIDGPTSWLSVDLQVFQVLQGGSLAHTPGIQLTGSPNAFISQLISRTGGGYNDPSLARAPNHPFDLDLVAHQDSSTIEWARTVAVGPVQIPVFNFAIARVRYRALANPAANVRCFFRLFNCSTTSTDFRTATYATGGSGTTRIPLLGIVNGEVVTIPCFAAARVDPTNPQGLNLQTDPDNVGPVGQPIPPDGTGAEVQVYFGCWLDINQTTPVLPASPASAAGPFTPAISIQQAIRTQHQCLVAEINMDPPLPQISTGQTPATSDKLAQRNLTIVGIASPHLVPHTFDIKPTRPILPPDESPDEIMIDWGNVPADSEATIYLPGTSADTILAMANRLYSRPALTRVDQNTVSCKTRGITYVPVPPGIGSNFAGLLSIDLPEVLTRDGSFSLIARQITTAVAQLPKAPPVIEIAAPAAAAAASGSDVIKWRRVLGTFQISIPRRPRPALLISEERLLSVLKWVAQSIPVDNRWYPIFQRYLIQVGIRVTDLGGDPDSITGSPDGTGRTPPSICDHRIKWLLPLILAPLLVLITILPVIWAAPLAAIGIVLVLAVACYWYWRCKATVCELIGALVIGISVAYLVLALLVLLGFRTPTVFLALAILGVLNAVLVTWSALRCGCFNCADKKP